MMFAAALVILTATPTLQLHWRGAPECPSREAFLSDVRRLRGEVREADDAEVTVDVALEPGSPRWRARVATRSRSAAGLRELEADTCAEAVAAAAVVVSLALAEPDATAAPEVVRTAAPAPAHDELAGLFTLGLTGGVRAGPLPAVAPGASLAAALTFGRVRVELMVTTPFVLRVATDSSQAELASWFSGHAAGCVEFSFGRVAGAPCLQVDGGVLAGRGLGGQATTSGSAALVAVSAGALLRARLFSSLWLRLDGAGGVAVARPRFVTSSDDVKRVVAESAPWLVTANLGFEWRFEGP
ncbi:MAG: hypothetical protein ACOZQL_00590 [Myxococcota bacterium]